MNFSHSLSALGILGVLALPSTIATAQIYAPIASQVSASSIYAELERPATSSSSSSYSADALESPAQSSISYPRAALSVSEGGSRPFSSVGVGFKIGIGGVGFDLATPLLPGRLNVRGGAGFFSYTYNGTIDNEPVGATLKLNNAEVMVDLFPFKGSFRLSAGTTVYNTTGLYGTVTVSPGRSTTIGNDTYNSDPANPLTGNLTTSFGGKAVPRFTLGWGNMVPRNRHIRFESELGVEIIQTPTVAWTYGGEACVNSRSGGSCSNYTTISTIPGSSADIAAQNASLQNDLNGLKVFPIFSLGLSYKIGH